MREKDTSPDQEKSDGGKQPSWQNSSESTSDSSRAKESHVESLQSALGNQAIQRLHRVDHIQAKQVASTEDENERKAEQGAEPVTRSPESETNGRKNTAISINTVGHNVDRSVWVHRRSAASSRGDGGVKNRMSAIKDAQREEKREEGYEVNGEVATEIESAQGSGESLDDNVQREMEETLGASLHNVNVHTDDRADRLSRQINAEAFTAGKDVFFRRGNYDADSSEGKNLLTHELTHAAGGSSERGRINRKKMKVHKQGDGNEKEGTNGAGGTAEASRGSTESEKQKEGQKYRNLDESEYNEVVYPEVKGVIDQKRFEEDLKNAEDYFYNKYHQDWMDLAQTMDSQRNNAVNKMRDIFGKNPENTFLESLGTLVLEMAIAGAVSGPVAARLDNVFSEGGFISEALQTGVEDVSTSLIDMPSYQSPTLQGKSIGGRIITIEKSAIREKRLFRDMIAEFKKKWEMRKFPMRYKESRTRMILPEWDYGVIEKTTREKFRPRPDSPDLNFQKELEKTMAVSAIKFSVKASGMSAAGKTLTFHKSTLPYNSLKGLVDEINGLNAGLVAQWSKPLPTSWDKISSGDFSPRFANIYTISPEDDLHPGYPAPMSSELLKIYRTLPKPAPA